MNEDYQLNREFMAVAEVAAYLRVSKMSVYRLIGDRVLPAFRIGRAYRIDKADLASYVEVAGQ